MLPSYNNLLQQPENLNGDDNKQEIEFILNHHHKLLILLKWALAPNNKVRIWVNSDLKQHSTLVLDGRKSGTSNKTFGWVLTKENSRSCPFYYSM